MYREINLHMDYTDLLECMEHQDMKLLIHITIVRLLDKVAISHLQSIPTR